MILGHIVQMPGEHQFAIVGPDLEVLNSDQVEELRAGQREGAGTVRRIRFILADEAEARHGHATLRLSSGNIACRHSGVPLMLANTFLPIGVIEGIELKAPGVQPDTEGLAIVAVATFHDNQLADIAWRAVQDNIFDGVCVVLLGTHDPATGDVIAGQIVAANLCDAESTSSPNARILQFWEQPGVVTRRSWQDFCSIDG